VNGLSRWWWNGRELVNDASLDIQTQAAAYGAAAPIASAAYGEFNQVR
jgi:hypothetical protein